MGTVGSFEEALEGSNRDGEIFKGNELCNLVRARTIVRRTPKRTYDYPTLNRPPHRFFTYNHPFFLINPRAID